MDVNNKKVLFITYDGLTDPLGQSQILPYIKGIANAGYDFTILSFEKEDKLLKLQKNIEGLCAKENIIWVKKKFNSSVPIISKWWDKNVMRATALALNKKNKYDIIHCRSYISSEVGLEIKQKFGAKFIFDMRGFWADEKKDGGSWNVKNPIFNYIYNYYKKKEKQYIQNADAIVSLTTAGKLEMEKWSFYNKNIPIAVIPCSVDIELFTLRTEAQKTNAKLQLLNLQKETFVVSYLGALGTWYCLPEMLRLFALIKLKFKNAKFLILTQTPVAFIESQIEISGCHINDFIIKEVSRSEVPNYIAATDINLSFIKPVYSKISSSPTKLGEVLAMGIPVVTNSGVGDVKEIVEKINGGMVIENFSEKTFIDVVNNIPNLQNLNSQQISENTNDILSLELAIQKYISIYKNL
jgi:glycosyltransferase involved in cell wall biosynthesis